MKEEEENGGTKEKGLQKKGERGKVQGRSAREERRMRKGTRRER